MFVEWSGKLMSWFPLILWRQKGEGREVCLTFDDGPDADVTPKVLDILDRYGVKATFFCVGENVQKYPDLFAEIKKRGHMVGNHTMHHIKGFSCGVQEYCQDVEQANNLIGSRLFRPPYGRIRLSQILKLRRAYKIVMWDVITRDYNSKLEPDKCFEIVKKYTREGSIIVFHDSKKAAKNMLISLPKSIEWLKNEGYLFKLVECNDR